MADQDETAKLWKVNRTIHELVKDRVSSLEKLRIHLGSRLPSGGRDSKYLTRKLTWISIPSDHITGGIVDQ